MTHKEFCPDCGNAMKRVYERAPLSDGQKFNPIGWKCSCNPNRIIADPIAS